MHTCGEGGGLDSLHILSTTFTNKQIDEKVPGEHLAGVKLKKYFCACITSVRRMKHLNFFSLNSPRGTRCGKGSERFQQKVKPGPFAWQLQMEPVWGMQPAKEQYIQTTISFAAPFSLSLIHLEFVPRTETWETEKCYLVIIWVALKSCLLGARVFVLRATYFLKKNGTHRKL